MSFEGFFDFFTSGKPVSIETTHSNAGNIIEPSEAEHFKNEKWTLYTLNPELKTCPLDCIIISNFFKFFNSKVQIKIVKCSSCSPNGKLPILVADSNGRSLETCDIISQFFNIKDVKLYAVIDGLLGDYIRMKSQSDHSVIDGLSGDYIRMKSQSDHSVIDLIHFLNCQEISLDSETKSLLFSLFQGAKMFLNHNDPVRCEIEKSEFLNNEVFVKLLESITK